MLIEHDNINLEVGRATSADASLLSNLAISSFPGYPFEYVFDTEKTAQAIKTGEQRYVLRSGWEPLASGVLGANDPHMAEIMRVMVNPKSRKNGAATLLTRELSLEATRLGKYPWADVRADQIGMQRAALASGLRAISLESGKHAVYAHKNEGGEDFGPARETMVHMTSLPVDEIELRKIASGIPPEIRKNLSDSLEENLTPPQKNTNISQRYLESPTAVKNEVLNKLHRPFTQEDIILVIIGDVTTAIILPDKSAFTGFGQDLKETLTLMENSGIQVVTLYADASDIEKVDALNQLGLSPSALRPWLNMEGKLIWQIAWRKTMNGFENCLHPIFLDRIIERQMIKLMEIIKRSNY